MNCNSFFQIFAFCALCSWLQYRGVVRGVAKLPRLHQYFWIYICLQFINIRPYSHLPRCLVWPSDHLIIWPYGHLVIWPYRHLVIQPSRHLVIWPFGLLTIRTSGHLAIQTFDHLAIWSSRHLTIWPSELLDI